MIRKKMVLADTDELYLKELRYEFMEKAPHLELITFTKCEKIYQYLEQGGAADILVVEECFAGEKLRGLSQSMTRIALSSSAVPIDGFEVVKKYQRMESLLNTILLKYAQDSGSMEAVRGNSNTRIAAFYSPAGGTGKTTLALALATAGAKSGLRTLYLNLEEIDSVNDILVRTQECLSDVFLALKTKGMQVGIKLKECINREPVAGFDYVSGVESISEFEEINGEDIKKLLETIRDLSGYELVILDQTSGFTEKTRRILEEADVVLMPVTSDEGSISKLQRFLGESKLHGKYDSLFDKMSLIINKAGGRGQEWLPDIVTNRIPCCLGITILPVLERRGDILGAGDNLLLLMTPVLQTVMAGESGVKQ